MTVHNLVGKIPVLSGRPVDQLLRAMRGDLIEQIQTRLVASVPFFSSLPPEAVTWEIRRACTRGMQLFATALSGGDLDECALDHARRGAARRAEEQIPLGQLMTAYGIGVEVCHARLMEVAGPGDTDAMAALNRYGFRFLREIAAVLAEGYAAVYENVRDDEVARRHAHLDALLVGEDVATAAQQSGLPVPGCYFVMVVGFDLPSGEGLDVPALGRHTAGVVRREVSRQVRGTVLSRVSGAGGTVLIPLDAEVEEPGDAEWQRLAGLVRDVGRAAQVPVTVAAVLAAPEGVAAAARLASELLDLAVRLGRGPGLHRLEDMALEYQLTRPTPASSLLAATLGSLSDEPELLETLRTYVSQDLSRRRTAARLEVHPNTVDNRLRKVARLTGLDVNRPTDLPLISAALATW